MFESLSLVLVLAENMPIKTAAKRRPSNIIIIFTIPR